MRQQQINRPSLKRKTTFIAINLEEMLKAGKERK